MLKKIASAITVAILISSCRKSDQPQPSPAPEKFDVLTTATLFNPATGHYEAACFINKERQLLASGGSEQTFAYGMDKANGNLYIAGGFAGAINADGDRILRPCYWKNGAKTDLSMIGLGQDLRCAASDVKWFNGTLFILGDADLKPVLWREENGHASITQFGFDKEVDGVRKTSNMQLYNNKLYIGGNQRKQVNGRTVFNAGYWTIDKDDKMEFHVIEENLEYALCFSISVSGKGIFLIGEAGTHAQSAPAVWSDHAKGRLPISGVFNPSTHRLHTGVVDSQGNLYLNVLDIQPYQPVIWKVPQSGAHQLIKPGVPADAKGFCETLDIRDDQLAYCYAYERNNQLTAAYVFNGKTVLLDVYNDRRSNINFLRLFLHNP